MATLLRDVARDLRSSESHTRELLASLGCVLEPFRVDTAPRQEGAKPQHEWVTLVKNPELYHRWRAREWFEGRRVGGHLWEESPFSFTSEDLGLQPVEIVRTRLLDLLKARHQDAVSGTLEALGHPRELILEEKAGGD